jgi:hypothetical protein
MAPEQEHADLELLKLVNDSGFPFQMAVTWHIEQSSREHGWKIVVEEHPWKHPERGGEGFVDQIIQHEHESVFKALLECKRVKSNGKLVFLLSPSNSRATGRLSLFWTHKSSAHRTVNGWHDFSFTPMSQETSFCVLKDDSNKQTLFERIADELLPAMEAIGIEEMTLMGDTSLALRDTMCYLPIVVTNASLYTANFDPATLDMKSGRFPVGACEFKEVPCIRFRKSLGTHVTMHRQFNASQRYNALPEANAARQRTILILNSDSLSASLKDLRIFQRTSSEFGLTVERLIASALR